MATQDNINEDIMLNQWDIKILSTQMVLLVMNED